MSSRIPDPPEYEPPDGPTVEQAQQAYARLGAERADEILGEGGLSGADAQQLRELWAVALAEVPHVVQVDGGEPISSCCGAADLNVTGIERSLVRWPVVGFENGKVLISHDSKFLEGVEEQDIEVWCNRCEQVLWAECEFTA